MIAYPGLTSDYQTSPFLTVLTSRGDRAKADSTLRSSQAVPHPSTDRIVKCFQAVTHPSTDSIVQCSQAVPHPNTEKREKKSKTKNGHETPFLMSK